jgi:UDP-2,3-diacylglucosamine hydrolase
MSPKLILQEGAILIADAHYSKAYPQFHSFLQAVDSGTIETKQLILMGDMFELLFGVIRQTHQDNEEEIALLNRLSKRIEIIYFEGNHDFGLQKLFPDVVVFPLQEQPQILEFKEQSVQLSHGDTNTPLGYQVYTKLIRNPAILFVIGLVDKVCAHCIISWLKSRGEKKDPCYKIREFKEIIHKRLKPLAKESVDVVIEGHFHQDSSFTLYGFDYINLASFACNQKYFTVQSNEEQFVLQETLFKESM